MRKISLFLISAVLFTLTGFSQLSGPKTIPGNYATIALAIADLNAVGVAAPGVTFTIASGYTETFVSPTDGLITATGTTPNDQIIFQATTGGTRPVITAATGTSTTVDGVIVIKGGDYITFDGIDIQENAANITPTMQMEWGYALVKVDGTNGAQNNTIKNCTITLNKANTSSAGIYSGNHTNTSTTALTITTLAGANSNNKFYGNTISNVFTGISVKGFADVAPYTYYDQNNGIGYTTNNVISNYGGATSSFGIYLSNNNAANITNNNISNTGTTNTLRGVYLAGSPNANVNVTYNNISLNSAATNSQCTGIENAISGTTNTININNNNVSGCIYATATTGAFQGILSGTGSAATLNINSNTIANNTLAGTGDMTLINSGSAITINMNSNIVNNNTKTGASGTMYCTRASTSMITYSLNQIHDNGFTATSGASTANIYGYFNAGMPTVENYINNAIYNLFTSGSSTSTANVIYGIYNSNTTVSSNITVTANVIYGLTYSNSSTGSAIVLGIRFAFGNINLFKNAVFSNTANGAGSTVHGIYIAGGTTWNIYNNEVFDLKTPSANLANAIAGIYIAGGTNINAYYNSIYLNASSTGTLFGTSGIYASTTSTVDLRNNIVVNASSFAGVTGYSVAYRRSGTTLTSYASTSNNNDFYAGTPGANNLIYYDGTNADQTIGAFQSRVTPRDAVSISENPPFVNVTTPPYDLRLQTIVATLCESGGQKITTPIAITDDIEGQVRWGETGYTGTGTSTDIGADEFDGIKPSCMPPTTLNASLVTSNSATLGWTAGGGEPSWDIQYGTFEFSLGTGTILNNVSTNPYSLTGLTSGTNYQFYVLSQCSTTDSSTWSGPFSFTTLCDAVTIPYSEGFESIAANNQLPTCMAATSLGSINLTYIAATTFNRTPHSGTKFASFRYAPVGNWFFFAPVQLTGGVSYDVSTWYITDGAAGFDSLNIAYGTSQNSASMTNIVKVANPVNTTYQQLKGTFVPATTGVYCIGIQANGTYVTPKYLTIDDILVDLTPSCIAPTALTATSITTTSAILGWTAGSTESAWDIQYGLSGFILGTGTIINNVITNPYTLTSLTSGSTYQFYVSAQCSPTDSSTWTGPFSFSTLCNAVNIPYTENFDGATPPALPSCMSKTNDNGDVRVWNTLTGFAHSAPNSMGIRANSALAMNDWFYTPGLNLLSSKTYKVSLYYRATSAMYSEKLEVKWGTAANAVAMTSSQVFNNANIVNSTYSNGNGIFTVPSDGVYYVGFHGYSNLNENYLYVDDIAVTEVNTATDILTFDVPAQTSSTVGTNTVDILMPCGTNVTALTPTITVSAGATISPASGVVRDFTNSVTYTVTAEDGISTSTWTVTVIAPALPIVNLGADVAQCGGSVTLDAGNAGSTYLWSDASANQTLVVSTTGTYSVTVTNINSCTAVDTINVNINTIAPTIMLTSPSTVTICQGDTTNIDLAFTGTAPWSWVGDDGSGPVTFNALSSPQTSPVNPSITTTYSVISVTDATGCSSTSTESVIVTVNSLPVVNLGTDVNQCGGSVTLDAGNAGSTYLWSDASANQTLVVSTTGTYSVTVTNTNGCTSADTIIVTINALPTVTITENAGTLTSDATTGNQWYDGSGLIAGEVNQTYTPTANGSYYVIVTDVNGCTATSNVVIITFVNTINSGASISVYPNPANDKVWIDVVNKNASQTKIEIRTLDGRLLFENESNNLGNTKISVDLKKFASGIYIVKATSNENTSIQKLIVK